MKRTSLQSSSNLAKLVNNTKHLDLDDVKAVLADHQEVISRLQKRTRLFPPKLYPGGVNIFSVMVNISAFENALMEL